MKITTESGTIYDLTNGYCTRNGRFEFKYWYKYCFDYEDGEPVSKIPQPYEVKDADRRLPIQVGKRMYLGGKNGWRISTKIVSIEETKRD
jgi:hypothetical protein